MISVGLDADSDCCHVSFAGVFYLECLVLRDKAYALLYYTNLGAIHGGGACVGHSLGYSQDSTIAEQLCSGPNLAPVTASFKSKVSDTMASPLEPAAFYHRGRSAGI